MMPSLTFNPDAAKECGDSDKKSGVQDYSLSLMNKALTMHEGDGDLTLSVEKFLLLYFRVTRHANYIIMPMKVSVLCS